MNCNNDIIDDNQKLAECVYFRLRAQRMIFDVYVNSEDSAVAFYAVDDCDFKYTVGSKLFTVWKAARDIKRVDNDLLQDAQK